MIYVFLADGFETIEALSCIDMMRRAQIEVQTVGVTGRECTSSNNIRVFCDITLDEAVCDSLDGVILPGGGEGTANLKASSAVHEFLDYAKENGLLIGAICAAPSILGEKGFLKDIEATAYPGFEKNIGHYSDKYVVTSGNIITARGAGVSLEFGLEIVRYLSGAETAEKIGNSIQCE